MSCFSLSLKLMFRGRLVYLRFPFANKTRCIEKYVYRFLRKHVYQFVGESFRSLPGVFIVQLYSIKHIISTLKVPRCFKLRLGGSCSWLGALGAHALPSRAQVRLMPGGRAPPAPRVCVLNPPRRATAVQPEDHN